MNVIRYKKTGNNKYKVVLDNNIELTLYEDVILKFELLLNKKINDKDLIKIKELNSYYDAYYCAIKSLNSKFKSIYDTKEYLLNKEYSKEIVDDVIDKLIEQGYLNDSSYARSFINNQIITTNRGPYKIISELNKHHISNDIISEEISLFDEDIQKEKINKIINKSIKSNKNRGGVILKNKIINDLSNLGYSIDIINKEIDNYKFGVNKEIREREYNKIYNKLSKKYSGEELDYKVREKLYLRGLYYED